MTFSVHGIAVTAQSGGIAIGRAVRVVSSRANVAHYFIAANQAEQEVMRLRDARNAVVADMQRLQVSLSEQTHKDAPLELAGILDVHLMLLQDVTLEEGVKHWIVDKHYNAEWALTTQLEILATQFDEMHDPYMRERKADLEQVAERLLSQMQATQGHAIQVGLRREPIELKPDAHGALVLVAHDLSPSDMLQFKGSVFQGFVTDVGGSTSHTAIVARSMGIPAIVGAKHASHLIRQDEWIIVDADAGVVIVDPSEPILAEYLNRQRESQKSKNDLDDYKHMQLFASDGSKIEVLANIESPADAATALAEGAEGVGLFRTEFLFMGRSTLPSEDEQYAAYCEVVDAMQGRPVTIRTIDIGADKPLDVTQRSGQVQAAHLNAAMGLRAIRWCLAEPAMFQTQLRALLRAAIRGRIEILIPMLAHESEIKQCLRHLDKARLQLASCGQAYGDISMGAMIEVPAAALIVPTFLQYFDFLSIGTNDLIQYTLAVDRADEAVAHLYDATHPAVQFLIGSIIRQCVKANKPISVCGEMAGDTNHTQALLDMGLRKFSMQPTQITTFKKYVKEQNI